MEIERVTCVGAGLIGHSWATLFAWKGYKVILQDIDRAALEYALVSIRRNLDFLAEKSLLKDETPEEILQKIEVTTNLDNAVKKADYIQESIPEKYEIKKKIFKRIDSLTQPQTIIASSTSTLKMTEIQKVTENPER